MQPETRLLTIRRDLLAPGVGELTTINVNPTSGPLTASGYLNYCKFKNYNPLAIESTEHSA